MSKVIQLRNPFDYSEQVISYLYESISDNMKPECGDKLDITVSHSEMYHICTGCLTVISDLHFHNIIENKDMTEEIAIPCQEFLASHAIFRCSEHDRDSRWTFQCLNKYPELDEKALHTDIV